MKYKYSLYDLFVYMIYIRILKTMKIKLIKSQSFIECIYYIWRCLHLPMLSHNLSGVKYRSVRLSHSFLCGEIFHTHGYFNGKFNWQNRLRSTRQGAVITYDSVIIYYNTWLLGFTWFDSKKHGSTQKNMVWHKKNMVRHKNTLLSLIFWLLLMTAPPPPGLKTTKTIKKKRKTNKYLHFFIFFIE